MGNYNNHMCEICVVYPTLKLVKYIRISSFKSYQLLVFSKENESVVTCVLAVTFRRF